MADYLTGAQLKQIEDRWQQAMRGVVDAMSLRKLAMQMALDSKTPSESIVEAAQRIYDFMSSPSREIVVRIEQ